MTGDGEQQHASGTTIKTPIVVVQDGDLALVDNIKQAEAEVEPPEAKDVRTRAFGADGQVIEVSVDTEIRWLFTLGRFRFGPITIERTRMTPVDEWRPDELQEALRSWLLALDLPRWQIDPTQVSTSPVDELIELVRKTKRRP